MNKTSISNWKTYRFDEMAVEIKDRVEVPRESGFDRYVGLTHLDPGSLKIWRWGSTEDVEKQKMLFKSGDIIFGRRNAYLRRVSVADFDGVCSAHAMVLRSRPEVALPEFLPFFMQTETFWQAALRNSAGSLSPTINWPNIAKEEFALPPLEEQRRIVDVLLAAERFHNCLVELANTSNINSEAIIDNQMRGTDLGSVQSHERVGIYHGKWDLASLGDLLIKAQYGISDRPLEKGRYPILRMMNLEHGKANENELRYVDLSKNVFNKYKLNSGDVLFNRTNSYELVGRTGVYNLRGDHVFASYLVRLITNPDRLLPEYLCEFLNAPIGRRQVMSFATRGVSQTNVNASNLKKVILPLPPIEYQQRVIDLLMSLYEAREAINVKCASLKSLTIGIINRELGI